jgi:hypothetical protein
MEEKHHLYQNPKNSKWCMLLEDNRIIFEGYYGDCWRLKNNLENSEVRSVGELEIQIAN